MKKRILSFLLAGCLMLSALPALAFASSKPSILYGDVKSDGLINMRDVLAMNQYIAEYGNSIDKIATDVTSDGKIDAKDLLLLKKFIAGWDVLLGPPFYTITFNSNGGSVVNPVKVRQSELIAEVPLAAKENAIFLGWYTDSGFTKPFYAEDAILANLTLYAKYAKTVNQEKFADNTFTLAEQKSDLSFEITCSDASKDSETVLKGITLENVGNSDYVNLNVSGSDGSFTVIADGGFTEGAAYKLTLSDNSLTFTDKALSYRVCTFTIAKAEVIDIALSNDLTYIKSNQLTNIIANGVAVDSLSVAVLGNADTAVSGSFDYLSAGNLKIGDSLCVYENVMPADRDTTTDYSDDKVAYVKVSGINGTTVSFKSADAEDVISMPDTLPILENELTTYIASGSFTANTSSLDFSEYTDIGLDDKTTVDAGDYLVITEIDNDIVYGKVVSVVTDLGIITVSFTVTTAEEMQSAAFDYYTKSDADGSVMLEDADAPLLQKQIEAQTVKSGFAKSALNYLAFAATKTDGFRQISGVENFVMTAADGSVVNPADINLQQFGIKSEGEDITVEATIDNKTEHFGKGLRIAVKVSGEISIGAGEDNEVVIGLSATFVEEVKMTFNADGGAVWKYWKGFIPYISDYQMNANIDVYNYTGISIAATVTLKEKDNGSIDISEELDKLLATEDEEEITAGVQNLFEAYGNMLENETGYVNIVNKTLTENKAWVDPFFIIAYSYKLSFVIGANVNLALGCNFEYMSGTRYNFWFAIKAKDAGSSTMDLIDETYAFQFYAMGHLGIRAGLQFEFAVGLFSTDLGSLGLVSEVGAYVELFGYFIYEYDSVRAAGSSQAETTSKMCGALYVEFGIYMEISFKAQALKEKYTYNPTLYEHQWPLLWAGEQINVYDFGYDQPVEDDVILIKDVTSDTLPASIRYMNCLDLKAGDLSVNEYDLERFYYNLSNKNFAFNEDTGVITVTVAEDVRYMECDLTLTWKTQKLAFSKDDLTRTVHLVWTNLTDTELSEKYDVCVKVGNNIVWSARVNRGETPERPTEEGILAIIGYNKYIINDTNLKFTGYTGYDDQAVEPITHNQTFTFGVTEREYTLNISDVQNEDGSLVSKEFTAKFGENFDLSSLDTTGTRIAGSTYTRYFNTECSSESGRAVTDRIDSTFATQLIAGTYSYAAHYVDNSCMVTYLFGTVDRKALGTATEKVEKGTIPVFDYTQYVLDQFEGYIVKDWDKTIGMVTSDTTFSAICGIPTGEKYTITFITNGGSSIAPLYRYQGAAITAPVVPTKTGYTFSGWYSDEEFRNVYTFAKMTPNSFTLYANWKVNKYIVTFDTNQGEGNIPNITVTYDRTYGTLPVATRLGYAFVGWYTAAEGGEMVEDITAFKTASNHTLFAHWLEKSTVTGIVTTAQTYTYNTASQPFIISGTVLDGFTVKYKKAGDIDWGDTAVNAGKYAVMITRPENNDYKAYEKVLTDALIINKARRTINAPASVTTLFRTISVSPVRDFAGYGDGAVEYGVSFGEAPPSDAWIYGWTTSQSIINLLENTNHYVFTRVTEGENYLSATSTTSTQIITGIGEVAVGSSDYFGLGIFVRYTGTVKTSDKDNAGTGQGNINMRFLYRDNGSSSYSFAVSSVNHMEQNTTADYLMLDKRDPWNISGISITNTAENDSAAGWHGEYVDIVPYSGAPATRIVVDSWFKDNYGTYVDYTTDVFKRNISDVGSFSSWGGDYFINSSSNDKIEYSYDGKITDQYGTYNAFAHEEAPQMNVVPSKQGYYDCFDYSSNTLAIDKATLYQKMALRGEDQIVFTISLKFDPRYSNTTEFIKTVTINRQ